MPTAIRRKRVSESIAIAAIIFALPRCSAIVGRRRPKTMALRSRLCWPAGPGSTDPLSTEVSAPATVRLQISVGGPACRQGAHRSSWERDICAASSN